MNIEIFEKPAFAVIGREGSTEDGPGFVQKLWAEANARFDEVAHLAKRDEDGSFVGFWGAMTDFSRSFQPWEVDFSRGLYLAGVECTDDAVAPAGWTRWEIPGFVYLKAAYGSTALFRPPERRSGHGCRSWPEAFPECLPQRPAGYRCRPYRP